MTAKTLTLETDHRIAWLTLNHTTTGNTIDERMAFELKDACYQVERDENIWAVVITALGDVFCRSVNRPSVINPGDEPHLERVSEYVADIEKPVIAALNGDAIGQGLELALACDLRIASSRAQFGLTQIKNGLMPWDGGTQRLPRLIGRGRGMEMILTGRVIDAHEAHHIGLLNEVTEPNQVLTRANEITSTIVSHGPIATGYLKEAVVKGLDAPIQQGLRLEADLNIILQSTADRTEGIRSFQERRNPHYYGE